jgi:AcrR family transcriptional regulator
MATTEKRVTKRRAETRQRLLDAASEAFAEEGFGRSTVEKVCERAGYTRGAFYSNFASLDELFLAMWTQRSGELLDGIRGALAGELDTITDVNTLVRQLVRAIPIDDAWYRITAEFTAHALRTPPLRDVMAAREDAIVATLIPIIEPHLEKVGRAVPDPIALVSALIAVHDGTIVQCLIEPENPAALERRINLFTRVVLAYSTEGTK